ncbi:LamG-like jellyroll fold domain-containing protein [Planctomycetaceae bacterium SH139]
MKSRAPRFLSIILLTTISYAANSIGQDLEIQPRVDKTLVVWAAPANLSQRGGSALTLQSGDRFDGIVLGERLIRKWMPGSDNFERTAAHQINWPSETADPETLIQLAIAYTSERIQIYRNGEPYADYPAENIDLINVDNHIAVFGLRHVGAGTGTNFSGSIDDARIYDRALTADQLELLEPNVASDLNPLAWWDFENGKVEDKAGRFSQAVLRDGAKVEAGRLILEGAAFVVAARSERDAKQAAAEVNPRAPLPPYKPETPAWPENPPQSWLTFHLAHPGPGPAIPGDPNCILDIDGTVHFHYIYRNDFGFSFAHLTSNDMVYWNWETTLLTPPNTGHGMFSGTGFFTKEGRPAIVYHGEGSGRNWIQFAKNEQLSEWSAPLAIVPKKPDGSEPEIRHWDPDLWIRGDKYYALCGGRNPQLMSSEDLQNWLYLGDLLHEDYPGYLGIPRDEDISCANFFRIGDQWMLLCISHGLGCRYYLGDFKDEKFLPKSHTMMSFGGNQFFAPESVLTVDGRRVMWAWVMNLPIEPTGVQSLPRELELPADGVLRIRPLRELAKLRYDRQTWDSVKIADGAEFPLDDLTGDAVELEVTFAAPVPENVGIHLLGDDMGNDAMTIVAGSGREGLRVGEPDAPFKLEEGEDLTLRVFIDKNFVEVFANDRQAVVNAHKIRPNPNVRLFTSGGEAVVKSIKAWKLRSIYHSPKATSISP